MRCRIGDLAVVVRTSITENLGMFVEVMGPCAARPGSWWVKSLSGARQRRDGSLGPRGVAADDSLWPIRGNAAEVKRRRSLARLAALMAPGGVSTT